VAVEAIGGFGPDARSAVPALAEFLQDRDARCRCHAASALWKIERHARAAPVLTEALQDGDSAIRATAAGLLADLGAEAKAAVAPLGQLLKDSSGRVRLCAAHALWRVDRQGKTAVPVITAALEDGVTADVSMAYLLDLVKALEEMGEQDRGVVPALLELARDKHRRVRRAAEEAVKKVDPEAARKAGIP
jgi:HEAT repeat protein